MTKLDPQKQQLEKKQVQRKKCFIKVPGIPIGIIEKAMMPKGLPRLLVNPQARDPGLTFPCNSLFTPKTRLFPMDVRIGRRSAHG
jgi:hypothetical protein